MNKVLKQVVNRPGLAVLLFILFIITVTNIKPDIFILGWDNFSSYFNIRTNLMRTFFATWREYRGLGVASDSESVDLYRQLFFLLLGPIVPIHLLDQLYLLISLNLGVLGTYFFASYLFRQFMNRDGKHQDVFGATAAFFYLFNLNTIATFFFPMTMYISRFFSIPLLFYIFFDLVHNTKISIKKYLFYVISIFFISGSYITATIFITMCFGLSIFGIFQKKRLRFLIIFVFYVIVNAFWLLPFANYTKEKTSLIRLAPTFISANEIQTNKPQSSFVPQKQMIFYSNFFDTHFGSTDNPQKENSFVRFTETFLASKTVYILWVFPILYLMGALFIFLKRKTELYWIPGILFFFLFFSMKEYSPLGVIYSLLSRLTPFIDVLFRFGDTKLHVYAVFAGSLCAAYAIITAYKYKRTVTLIFLIITVLLTSILFKDYFTGNLVGAFIYNKLPEAYADLANRINSDKEDFRVLHLPYDKDVYWKSYSWGMVGSAFLNFMLDHPIIDKTFEPASMENASLHRRIFSLIDNMQGVRSEEGRLQRAKELAQLLQNTGVKYIIFDDTISASVPTKGVIYWGNFHNPDTRIMINALQEYGFAKKINEYSIDLQEIASYYQKIYPLTTQQQKILSDNPYSTIYHLQMNDVNPPVAFIKQGISVDPLVHVLEQLKAPTDTHYLQNDTESVVIYPFQTRSVSMKEDIVHKQFIMPFTLTKPANSLTVNMPQVQTDPNKVVSYITIEARKTSSELMFSFNHLPFPEFNGVLYTKPIKTVSVPLKQIKFLGNLKLQIGETVFALPAVFNESFQSIATVAVSGSSIPIYLLEGVDTVLVDNKNVQLTQPPNCFSDKLANSSYEFTNSSNISLKSTNQSTCFWFSKSFDERAHIQAVDILINLKANHTDIDSESIQNNNSSTKPALARYINSLPKPNSFYACVRPAGLDNVCLNQNQLIDLESGEKQITIPVEKTINGLPQLNILFGLKNSGIQEQEVDLSQIRLRFYKDILADNLVLPFQTAQSIRIEDLKTTQITISIPQITSLEAFSYTPDTGGLLMANNSCTTQGGYRTFRKMNNTLISSIDNCYTSMYVPIAFDSSHFYLWTFNYNLLSGKFPTFIVNDKYYAYTSEMVSEYEGYPDIPGFKVFQKPEISFISQSPDIIMKNLPYQSAYGFLPSHPELQDVSDKKFQINHDAENEGIMAVKSFTIQPLPSQWEHMTITSGENTRKYVVPENITYQSLLPSFKKITFNQTAQGSAMLYFNMAYDRQWRMYPSVLSAVFGLHEFSAPIKCDGYANCFQINVSPGSVRGEAYILYTPERLSWVGWLVTLIGIGVFAVYFIGKNTSAKAGKHTNLGVEEIQAPQPID